MFCGTAWDGGFVVQLLEEQRLLEEREAKREEEKRKRLEEARLEEMRLEEELKWVGGVDCVDANGFLHSCSAEYRGMKPLDLISPWHSTPLSIRYCDERPEFELCSDYKYRPLPWTQAGCALSATGFICCS